MKKISYTCATVPLLENTYSQSTMKVYGVRTLMQHITFACVNIALPNQKIVCLRSKTYFILTKQLSSNNYTNSLERYRLARGTSDMLGDSISTYCILIDEHDSHITKHR